MTAPFPDPDGEAAWRAAVGKVLKGGDPASLIVRTADRIPVRPLYPPADAPGPTGARPPLAVMERLDEAEGTAGAAAAGAADGLVLVCQGSASARGFGLDLAALDVARLDAMLAGIPLERVPLRLEPTAFANFDALDAVLALAKARRCDPSSLDLDAGLDPIGDFARIGAAPPPSTLAFFGGAAKTAWTGRIGARMLRADGRAYHETGATEAQELAAVVATGLAYMRAAERAGMPLAEARLTVSFTLAADADEMLTIAKFRALRRLWAHVEAACGLAPAPIRLHAETSWRMMTGKDPHTNLLRTTLACAGAILGGADSLSVLPFTLPLGLPDAFARRLARNTALILRDEAGLDRVADPAAGSGALEALTEALCAGAWDLFQGIEAVGGMAAALADGSWRARIATARETRRSELRDGTRKIVGTTAFAMAAELSVAVLRPAPAAATPGALDGLRDDELVQGAITR